MRYLLVTIWVFWLGVDGFSQQLTSLRTVMASTATDTIVLDEWTVAPESVEVMAEATRIDSSAWSIVGNRLIWHALPETDSVIIRFRVFPFSLALKRRLRDPSMIFTTDESGYIGTLYTPGKAPGSFFSSHGLDYNGSFTRGIAFGNRQNLSLNSNLNLQLNGSLGDGIELLAAISDNNLPIQPQGNTSQLQEFDRVFIQIRRNDGYLTAGDYELTNSTGHFTRYYKRLQGASGLDVISLPNGGQITARAGVAISRGKFSRNSLIGSEGNQGPYRLKGADGEEFIIVLAGTEKVYVDGRLMKRGQEFDYIIDYNRGTIAFTSNRLITKDIRIIVEFEYATRQYLRTLHTADARYEKGPLEVYASSYSEQDGRFSGAARSLTADQIVALTNSGDAPDGILASGQRPGDQTNDPVLYKKVAVNAHCPTDSIYVRASPEEGGIWAVTFSEVGSGNGHYRRLPAEAVGTVFEWVPPGLDCQPSGDYAPVLKLVPPGQQQLHAAGIGMQFSEHSGFRAEAALSRTDLNRFSALGDHDNSGVAVFLEGRHRVEIGQSLWSIDGDASLERVQNQFKALNPWRQAEFARDWNLEPTTPTPQTEYLGSAAITLNHAQNGFLKFQTTSFSRDTAFSGIRHQASLQWSQSGWAVSGAGNWLTTTGIGGNTAFSRPNFSVSKTFLPDESIQTGVYFEQELNRRSQSPTDSLQPSSFRYELAKWFAQFHGSEQLKWSLGYAVRWDYAPSGTAFMLTTTGHNYTLSGEWKQHAGSEWKWNLTFRQLEVSDSTLFAGEARNTLLGRVEHRTSLLHGFVRSTMVYDISSGQEQKVEFVYRPVQLGEQGTHLWEDRNDDGLIQFDEVELPPFPEAANVVRITQFTESFIRTENARLNAMMRLDPANLIRNADGLATFARKLSAQLALTVDRKTSPSQGVRTWDPLQFNIPDSALIALNSTLRTDVFLNRGSTDFDLQWSWIDQRNRVVLTTGYEGRRQAGHTIRARATIAPAWVAVGQIGTSLQGNDSEFFETREYRIHSVKYQPEIHWQPSAAFRASLIFQYTSGRNTLPGGESGETARQHDLKATMTINQSAGTSVSASVSMVRIRYLGQANTPVAFAMLNGLQDGQNYLWNLSLDRRLENNIQLRLSYDGRQTGVGPIIHIGRVEVRAAF